MEVVSKVTKLGTSLHVPSVLELAKEKIAAAPISRYVRSDQEPVLSGSIPALEVPAIDMAKLLDRDTMDTELNRLHRACKELGFFQLINHGVSNSLLEKVKTEVGELFNLPPEEKKKFCQTEGDLEGFGQAFVFSEEQKLDWADVFFIVTLPTYLRKPHLLPQLPLSFRNAVEAYSMELKSLAMKLFNVMAKALKMNPEELQVLFEEGMQTMRMNYYPPCPQSDQVIGLTPHSDADGLTILLQLNETEGLQVKKDDIWMSVKPLPSAFVVNIGDILEIVTNGTYTSSVHRGVVNSVKERMSLATFLNPNLHGEFGPAPSLLSSETPPKYERIGTQDFLRGFFAKNLDGKSYLDTLRI